MSRSRRERGAAAVEFALVAPLLLLLVMGIVDFGWMLMQASLLNNTTRDAARVASLSGTHAQIDSTVDAGLESAGISADEATVVIDCTNASGTNCDGTATSYDANAASGSTVTVTVEYTHQWLTPFGSMCALVSDRSCVGNTILLERTATMVRE